MKLNYVLIAFAIVLLTSFQQKEEWTVLLDKDLSQWDTYLSFRHTKDFNGTAPKDANGNLIAPIGYSKDSERVFSIVQKDNEQVLRISGEIYGCLFTKQEYENYHLKLKIKWGEQKHEPRKSKLKDSGVLYHSVGESGVDYWRSWMLAQEFQIMEGHMGDYWNIATSAIDIRAYLPEGKMNSVAAGSQPFLPFGTGAPEGFCLRNENRENNPGEWTSLELISFQGKSLHIVNGHVVMILQNSRYIKDGKSFPLTKGKLQLQSEGAEIFFKDIHIKNLDTLPKEYASLF
jgi:hypothetical protein